MRVLLNQIKVQFKEENSLYIYIYIYMGWVQITFGITLSNVTPPNNLLLNSYFENLTIELHILYVLNMYTNFHANRM